VRALTALFWTENKLKRGLERIERNLNRIEIFIHHRGVDIGYLNKKKLNKANEPTSTNAGDPVDTQPEADLF